MILLLTRRLAWITVVADQREQADEDLVYEQDVQRNPGSTKPWLAYIDFKVQHGTVREQAFVMERACLQLPRSYKLWRMVRSTDAWLIRHD